jgi:hypothetical protein
MELQINNYTIQVDSEDAEWVASLNWTTSCHRDGRVYFQHWNDGKFETLHRLIAEAGTTDIVDHIDQDTLNNTRENLRCVDKSANALNTKLRKDSTTGYRGVTEKKDGRKKKWKAYATYRGRTYHLGAYYTPEEAAKAYDTFWKETFPNVRVFKNFEDIV